MTNILEKLDNLEIPVSMFYVLRDVRAELARLKEIEQAAREALTAIRGLPEDALGYGETNWNYWPLRDELVDKLAALLEGDK